MYMHKYRVVLCVNTQHAFILSSSFVFSEFKGNQLGFTFSDAVNGDPLKSEKDKASDVAPWG